MLAAFDKLHSGKTSFDPVEQRRQRIRKTLGVGWVLDGAQNFQTVQKNYEAMQNEGFDVWIVPASAQADLPPHWRKTEPVNPGIQNFNQLADCVNAYNLHVLHVGSKLRLWRAMAALTGARVFIPPLVIGPQSAPEDGQPYADWYGSQFCH
jgi:hypothetical protein